MPTRRLVLFLSLALLLVTAPSLVAQGHFEFGGHYGRWSLNLLGNLAKDALNDATKDEIREPEKAVEAVQLVYDISDDRKNAIRASFLQSNDMSRYGLVNAITQFAHQGEPSPEVGMGLEQLGASLLYIDIDTLYKRADSRKKEVAAA